VVSLILIFYITFDKMIF